MTSKVLAMILDGAIDRYGADHQKISAIKGISKLQMELTKDISGEATPKQIIKAMGEMYFSFLQLIRIYNVDYKDIDKVVVKEAEKIKEKLIQR